MLLSYLGMVENSLKEEEEEEAAIKTEEGRREEETERRVKEGRGYAVD